MQVTKLAMCQRLPLSKPEIKTMFLKVLYEIQYGGMKSYSRGTDSIVPSWINEKYNIKMSREEIQLAQEVIQELKTSGLIAKDSTQTNDVFQLLTDKGKNVIEKKQDPDAYALRLEQLLRNAELLTICLDAFNEGDFEIAVFKAFRFVEEKVRAAAHLDARDVGTDLMNKAFSPTTGKLVVTTCAVPAEQEGVQSLFRGAISFFKNPSSHRAIDYNDRLIAIKTIVFAELLLGILSKAKLRT
jgi:uncharacterized protein (TIGR02391 family)